MGALLARWDAMRPQEVFCSTCGGFLRMETRDDNEMQGFEEHDNTRDCVKRLAERLDALEALQ